MAKPQPIKLAIVGLGRAGYNIHLRRVREDKRYQVTAVTDWVESRIIEVVEELGCEGYPDYRDLLRYADAEVVVVASASESHPDIACAALRSGRHAIVEKPMANTPAAARRMIRTAQQTGRQLLMHHNRRFSQEFLHLKQLVSGSKLGEIFEIRMRDLSFHRRCDWQTLRQFHGGLLNNAGSHYLDLGLQLLGSPVQKLYCDLKQVASAGDVEDHVKVLLTAANGRVLDLELSTACKVPENRWTLLGAYGTAVCTGSQTTLHYYNPRRVKPLAADPGAAANRRYDNDDVLPWQEETIPATAKGIGDFYDNVWAVLRQGKEPVVKPEEALQVVETIAACKKCSGFYD